MCVHSRGTGNNEWRLAANIDPSRARQTDTSKAFATTDYIAERTGNDIRDAGKRSVQHPLVTSARLPL